ncbi:ATP-binding cassette domain-containing protein [Microbacterium barkeri]|uniref:ATP-binding cassette domain-containing protein n=1 Tax=Microbacterium barkeri TaxID=33917 RepID=UPI0024AF5738|nr:ATP-binding cassette domain-containing protein [Microbacterium barkeri]MDI6944926.1 ATP-binding cassette domain-containing protein [Microbacterium barkeri]
MTTRSAAVRTAAVVAAGFIVVRIVYRILFHGADGDGAVLWALPELRLPRPFAHVRLLGEVTADGLADAALSAVPIALVILGIGVLTALVDVPRLLAHGARGRFLGGICRALAIAWATVPSLADAVRAARFAQRLRDERNAVRLLAPVLERAIERATALSAALELRGYAARPSPTARAETAVLLDGLRAGFGRVEVVRVDALALPRASIVCLSGPTGAGKSTLLRLIAGLHTHVDGGWMAGRAEVVGRDRSAVPPRDLARDIGVVLQQPRQAFAAARVADEIGFTLELRGVSAADRREKVADVAERMAIGHLLERPVRGLSAGEATLVALASAIVDHPALLLVDEPLADLDADFRGRIVALLDALAHRDGMCVVVAEHRMAELASIADLSLRIEDGAAAPADLRSGPERSRAPRRTPPAAAAVALAAHDVTVRRGTRIAVDEASLDLHAGEVLVLTGPNGAGKSSLLEALATGAPGVAVAGGARRRVALVPDASDDLLLRDTVAAECRAADRRFRPAQPTAERLAAFLGLEPGAPTFTRILRTHPRDLSAGQRRCLAIALQTARSPRALLIDEPTRGLDPAARALVARAVLAEADAGVGVLLATHDAAFAELVADRRLAIADGRVGAPATEGAGVSGHDVSTRFARSTTGGRSLRSPNEPTRFARSTTGGRALAEGAGNLALLALANLVAVGAFLWPLFASALPTEAQAAVPYVAVAVAPLAVIAVLALLDGSVRSAHTLAHLAVLGAVGAAIRIVGTGVGGVEALFVLLILAGRVLGARFGLLLGAVSIGMSALLWGGVGPWLPFQMFACGWVAAGAGLLPRRVRGRAEIAMLCVYGVAASYAFGLIMNMWFWPFAVGAGTGASYAPGAPLAENLASFLVYSLVTSTLSWDTLRAITTVVGLALVGTACLRALRRAKPAVTPRSTSLPGGGRRTRPSTARDAAAAPR